jgi:hypothetical protein
VAIPIGKPEATEFKNGVRALKHMYQEQCVNNRCIGAKIRKEAGRIPPPRLESESSELERNAQTELNPAAALRTIGRNQFLADDAEGGWALKVQCRLEEIDMIEDVKEVG